MEFGASLDNEVIYMSDSETDSPEAFSEFMSTVREWINIHGIVLSEGTTEILKYDGPPYFTFKLTAPRVEGPFPFTARIS